METSKVDWSYCPLVEAVPGRMSGRPVVRDTRVPADTLWECEALGETPEEIASDYRLRLSDVEALLAYAAAHQTSLAPVR